MFSRQLFSLLILFAALTASAEAEPALDRFGDALPDGAVARLGDVRLRPERPIITGAFTPDGKLLATAGQDGVIVCWDTATGKEARRVTVNLPGRLAALRFSADGKSLIVVGDGGAFRIVDAVRGAEERKLDLPKPDALLALDVSADGKVAATLHAPGTIHVWDLAAGKHLHAFEQFHGNNLWQNSPGQLLALTPDGKQLALPYSDGSLHLLETATGKEIRAVEMPPSRMPGRQVRTSPQKIAISPDGRYLAYASLMNGAVLCDLKTGKRLRELGLARAGLTGLAFAPNSRFLAVCSHAEVRAFGIVSGKEIRRFARPFGSSSTLLFSPDGRFLARGHADGSIIVHGTATGKQLATWQGRQGAIYALAFNRDGRLLASGGDNGTILVWKLCDGEGLPATLTAEQAVALWQALVGGDAARAQRAIAGLAAAPAQALPLLKERFRTLAKPPTAERLARLIAELDDDSFKVREQATRELADSGADTAIALREALANKPSAEMKRRIETLLARLNNGIDPRRLHCQRVIEVLERIGTSTARDLLRELARKPLSAELREEIQLSLQRLQDRP